MDATDCPPMRPRSRRPPPRGLGWFRGFGYCLATDWHTRIQRRRGRKGFPHGYIRFLCERLAGIDADPAATNRITMTVFFVALVCSLAANFF